MKEEEKRLLEEQKKRFRQILEYTVLGGTVDEAGDDDQQPQDGQGGAPQDGGMPPMGDPNGGADAQGGGMPPAGGPMPPQGAPDGGAPQDGNMPPADGGMDPNAAGGAQQGPAGFNPQVGGQQGGDISAEDFDSTEQPSGDDDVVDISDLTDSQKDTEHEIAKVNDKFGAVVHALGAFEKLIKDNDAKIEDFKAEFEKRNPTPTEKLSMQTAKSGPYNVTPEQYWDEKERTSNYSREDDNNGKGDPHYQITQKDIDSANDMKAIADSLDDDLLYHQTLNGVMNF